MSFFFFFGLLENVFSFSTLFNFVSILVQLLMMYSIQNFISFMICFWSEFFNAKISIRNEEEDCQYTFQGFVARELFLMCSNLFALKT